MSVDATVLSLGVETSGIQEGISKLDGLSNAARKAEGETDKLIESWAKYAMTLNRSKAEVIAMEAAQLNLTKAQQDNVVMILQMIKLREQEAAALERHEALMRKVTVATVAFATAVAAGLVALVKHSIDAADGLRDLAIGTGRTKEELQSLGVLAEKNGTSLDGMLGVLNTVSRGMTKNGDDSGRYARALEFLGVSARDASGNLKSAEQVAREVAEAYAGAEKTASTAAAAQIALGGSYEKQIPALLELSKQQEELNKLKEYGAVVDDNLADASDNFNDTMTDVKSIMSGFGNDLSRTVLPLLQSLADWFIRSATNGGIMQGILGALKGAWEATVFVLKVGMAVFIQLDGVIQIVGKSLGALIAIISSPMQASNIWKELKADIKAIETETYKAMENLSKSIEKTDKVSDDAGKSLKNLGDFAARGAKQIKEQKDQVIDYEDAIAQLELATRKQEAAAAGVAFETSNYEKVLIQIEKDLKAGKIVTNEQIDAYLAAATALDKATASAKEAIKARKDAEAAEKAYADANKRNADVLAKSVEAIEKEAEAQEQRVLGYDKAKSVLTEVAIIQEKANLAVYQSTDADQASIEAIKARIAALERLKKAQQAEEGLDAEKDRIKEQQKAYEDMYKYIDDLGRDVWASMTGNGENAAKKITEAFKTQLLGFLYKLAVQPFVVNIAANLSGTAGAAAGAAGGGGGGGIMGLLGGGPGSGFSGIFNTLNSSGIMGTLFGPAFSAAAGAGMTAGFETLSIALSAGAEAVGGFAAVAGAAAASIVPVVGAVAAAGYMIYNFLKSKGGGPKEGGFAASGGTPGISGTDDSGARWFTPNTADKELTTSVNNIQKQYDALLKAFGGTGDATFAVGYDKDPKGKAPNRAHVGVFANGQQVYNQEYGDLGKDDAALSAALELEAKRQLLAALQASNLPDYLANLLNSVEAKTADAGAIDNILAMAGAVKTVVEAFEPLGGVFTAFSDKLKALNPEQLQGLADAFGGIDKLGSAMAFLSANFTTTADKMDLVTNQLNDGFAKLGIAAPKTHEEFLNLVNGIDLSTAAGQELYASIMALAPAFIQVHGTADDVAAAAEAAATKLQQLKDELYDYTQENFTTDDQKHSAAVTAVEDMWKTFGLGAQQLPKTHDAFLAVVQASGLTVEQQLLLEKAYIRAYGTAQQAADAEQALADARADAVKNAEKIFNEGFYTKEEQAARTIADGLKEVNRVGAELGIQIPTTVQGFRNLIESIDRTTPAGEALYQTLILLAPTILDMDDASKTLRGSAEQAADAMRALEEAMYNASQAAAAAAGNLFQQIMGSIENIVSGLDGDFGQQTTLKISLIAEQIRKYQALMEEEARKNPYSPLITQYQQIIAQLSQSSNLAAQQLARFTVLAAQYDAERAEQLVLLEQWYAEQQALLAGNPEALAALAELFQKKWDDIINGVSNGVNGTIEQLKKLREAIREYLNSLTLSELSPASPLTKLAEARKQYEEQLKLAQSGDTTALANITKYADQYLRIAREVYKSSPMYNAIFELIYDQLEALTKDPKYKPTTGPGAITNAGAPTTLESALPKASPLASQEDIKELKKTVGDALADLIDAVKSGASNEKVVEKLSSLETTMVGEVKR